MPSEWKPVNSIQSEDGKWENVKFAASFHEGHPIGLIEIKKTPTMKRQLLFFKALEFTMKFTLPLGMAVCEVEEKPSLEEMVDYISWKRAGHPQIFTEGKGLWVCQWSEPVGKPAYAVTSQRTEGATIYEAVHSAWSIIFTEEENG